MDDPSKDQDTAIAISEMSPAMEETTTADEVTSTPKGGRRNLIRAVLGLGIVAAVAGLSYFGWSLTQGFSGKDEPLVLHAVSRGDLPIIVTERGSLESQNQTDIQCEVENLRYDRSGTSGAQILFIVPNGKQVTKDELLVELDSGPIRELLDNQVLALERARTEKLQADAKYENQLTQNETRLAEADLQVELAKLDLTMYDDGDDGTYRIQLQELDLKVQESKNQIREAETSLLMQTTERKGIELLYRLGYRGKGDLDKSRFSHLQAEDELVRAINSLANSISSRKKLVRYEHPMQRMTLEGSLETAKRNRIQVVRDNESLLAQATAVKEGAEQTLAKEQEKMEKYQEQLTRCKIFAPHDGMVVYANQRGRRTVTIGEGVFVDPRQTILTLPDLSSMQVKTSVHESVLDQIRPGLPATVRIDAFPDRNYSATVRSVSVLPDQGGWLSSDVKVYETVVSINEAVEHLKPGMTAVVEIHVDRLQDVLSVPVQAIVQRGRKNWCYVADAGGVTKKAVDLGRTNDRFVHVKTGLAAGEQVVLNPMAIFEEQEQTIPEIAADAGAPEPLPEQVATNEEPAGEAPEKPPADKVAATGDSDGDAASESDRQRPRRDAQQPGGEGRGGRGRSLENLTPEQRAEWRRRAGERKGDGERRGPRARSGDGERSGAASVGEGG